MRVACVIALLLLGCGDPSAPVEVYHVPLDDLEGIPRIDEQAIELVDESFDGGKSIFAENFGLSLVPLRNINIPEIQKDDQVLIYRAMIKTHGARGSVYPDIEVELNEGELYSAIISREEVLRGDNDWTMMEREFVLEPGQKPLGVRLNVVILGRALVWIDDLHLLTRPRRPEETTSAHPDTLHEPLP